jgi:hypothetical protein
VIAQATLEKVEAAGRRGIDVSQPLGTLELVRAAMGKKDYRSAHQLALRAQVETQALPKTAPVPKPKAAPVPSKVTPPPVPSIKAPAPEDEKELKKQAKKEAKKEKKAAKKKAKKEKKEAKKDEEEELEPEVEDEEPTDEDLVLEYELDPQMSERIAKLKSEFVRPIQEGMSTIETRLSHAQEMLKRVQDLDETQEGKGEVESEGESETEDESEPEVEEENVEEQVEE